MMYLRTQFNVGSSNGSLIAVNKRVVKYGFQAGTVQQLPDVQNEILKNSCRI